MHSKKTDIRKDVGFFVILLQLIQPMVSEVGFNTDYKLLKYE
jgi:hypothetical protein